MVQGRPNYLTSATELVNSRARNRLQLSQFPVFCFSYKTQNCRGESRLRTLPTGHQTKKADHLKSSSVEGCDCWTSQGSTLKSDLTWESRTGFSRHHSFALPASQNFKTFIWQTTYTYTYVCVQQITLSATATLLKLLYIRKSNSFQYRA